MCWPLPLLAQADDNFLDRAITALTSWFAEHVGEYSFLAQDFNIRGLLAVILVSLICGAVGSLVVGNRMAFFSDALAHSSFAGVGIGLLIAITAGAQQAFFGTLLLPVMIGFGTLIGLLIAFISEKTSLANDTVIGVAFAGAMGFGAMVMYYVIRNGRQAFDLENFLFGNPLKVTSRELVALAGLAVVTLLVLAWMYNYLLFATFNPSLARSRRVPVRLCNYLFIVLLACIVNLCLWTVGALLINALLIVPAATAANVCRNMRQVFWTATGLCLVVSIAGQCLSWQLDTGSGGPIVCLSVVLFFLSMAAGPRLRGRQA
jgi:zinc transport system permease protein